jgi:CRISPR-associated endonuclease Cas1
MHSLDTTGTVPVPVRNGIAMLNGYGVKIAVDRRHLAVSDGVGRQRRASRFAKATSRLKRLIVVAETGFVSFEALRWLRDAKVAFAQLDHEATLLTVSVEALDDARLRRAQALLAASDHRLAVSRELLEAKIAGQIAVIDSFGLSNAERIREQLDRLQKTQRIDQAMVAEAKAAEYYFEAWEKVEVVFARRDVVPDHWRTFGARRSPLTLRPRNATTPMGSMLNYIYALLEIETRIALASRALDCGLSFFHADQANRRSLAADVMEPVRPHVDAFVLNLARTRTFSAKDFVETREGGCRLSASLAHDLARTMTQWAKLVAPYAEGTARHVARLAKSGLGVAAPIGAAPLLSRARIKVRSAGIVPTETPKAVRTLPVSVIANFCKACGAKVNVRKRVYCNACFPTQMAAQQRAIEPIFVAAGPAKLAAMRAAGHDPTSTPEVRRRRAQSVSKQRKAAASWRDDGSLDGVDFNRDILSKLQTLTVRAIAQAIGVSDSHASKIRGGKLRPHRRHWSCLLTFARDSGNPQECPNWAT